MLLDFDIRINFQTQHIKLDAVCSLIMASRHKSLKRLYCAFIWLRDFNMVMQTQQFKSQLMNNVIKESDRMAKKKI